MSHPVLPNKKMMHHIMIRPVTAKARNLRLRLVSTNTKTFTYAYSNQRLQTPTTT